MKTTNQFQLSTYESVTVFFSNLDVSTIPNGVYQLLRLKKLQIKIGSFSTPASEKHLLIGPKALLKDFKNRYNKLGYAYIEEEKPEDFLSTIGKYKNIIDLQLIWWMSYYSEERKPGIKRLSKEIGSLHDLEVLDLSGNKLQGIPPEISQLVNLKKLDVSSNHLQNIPPEINRLTSLREFNLHGNSITNLPSLKGLKQLSELNLVSNKLKTFPKEICEIKNLINLNLGHNPLTSIPSEIGDLENLESLLLHWTGIQSLPKEMQKLSRLKELFLANTALSIPPEFTKPDEILSYCFSLREQGRVALNELKLLVIGQGSVGKTSLIQQILQGTFNKNQSKTQGIFLSKWQVQSNGDKSSPIKVNIWDFGGQEIMHATHQFFLTKRSLYILVLDARIGQNENRVEYWLRIIQSFGGNSPIIIVGNKIDQQLLDIDRRGLQSKYPNIKAFVETSCLDGRGIDELKDVISQEIFELPHVRDEIPESWFQVKEKLEKLDKDFIPYVEYEALCNEGRILDETSQDTLIGFLHDLGTVLNFRDDPRLLDTNILNPEWVTNGVYRILNSNELFQKNGVLETKQLGKMLDRKSYPKSRHMFIVDMMRKFELCYPFEDDEGKYLVPDLLPREEPFTGEWSDTLAFEFHYSVLPGSIISRFIVRMHPFIHRNTVWRAGVVLKSGDNLAFVKADYDEKKIFIHVAGKRETRRDVLAMVRDTLGAIHKTITSLEAVAKVPHPDYPELVLDYDELVEFEKQAIVSFPRKTGSQVVVVDVSKLLDGVESKSAPQVFISYAHEDEVYANKIAKSLKTAGLEVWIDNSKLQGGSAWVQEIARGITQSKLVLNILSQDSIESDFVEKEILYSIDTAKKKVIPLRIKNVQPPLILANVQYIDFYRKNYENTFNNLLELIKNELSIC